MFNIQKYLERFSKNLNSIDLHKKQILETIKNNTGIEIQSDDVELKELVLLVKASPGVKNKLFIYKSKILLEIGEKTGLKILDIK